MAGTDSRLVDQQFQSEPVKRRVGIVDTLWRYPVKSMRGERMAELAVGPAGAVGDRAWALRDPATGRIASAKICPRLLELEARYAVEPTHDRPGTAVITLPDGTEIAVSDPLASKAISKVVGRELRLESRPLADEKTTIDRSTVFGDVPVNQMKPDWTPATMPDYFQLRTGTFLEIGALFLLTSGTVEHLRMLQGRTGAIDQRRFRPNIYIDSLPEWQGFVEDAWLDRQLALGDSLVCRGFEPTLWCVTSTLAQEDLPRDLSILRTTANHHAGCLGVYGAVAEPGVVRVGDPVTLR